MPLMVNTLYNSWYHWYWSHGTTVIDGEHTVQQIPLFEHGTGEIKRLGLSFATYLNTRYTTDTTDGEHMVLCYW